VRSCQYVRVSWPALLRVCICPGGILVCRMHGARDKNSTSLFSLKQNPAGNMKNVRSTRPALAGRNCGQAGCPWSKVRYYYPSLHLADRFHGGFNCWRPATIRAIRNSAVSPRPGGTVRRLRSAHSRVLGDLNSRKRSWPSRGMFH
jgi:hypothetical protein